GEDAGDSIPIDSIIEVRSEIEVQHIEAGNRYDITLQVKDDEGKILFTTSSGWHDDAIIMQGRQFITCIIPPDLFNTGTFYINLLIVENRRTILFIEQDITKLLLIDSQLTLGKWMGRTPGFMKPLFKWTAEATPKN
ncbi:MAG TPA: hypothetical protein VK808_04175, partial [Bacteroidia bacterium]|nr:hypothetical protein [Bacteroidia bacterium]